jgi:hypothetical protein
VEKAVSILRKYAGCEVPLVANFIDYRQRSFVPGGPSQLDLILRQPAYLSLLYLIIFFVVIPIAILLPIILILRKVKNRKRKNFN